MNWPISQIQSTTIPYVRHSRTTDTSRAEVEVGSGVVDERSPRGSHLVTRSET